jgi:hypothetical protein
MRSIRPTPLPRGGHRYIDWQQDEANRQLSHAKQVPPRNHQGYPDVYVNGPDVDNPTVTVDPWKNAHWIRDDSVYWRFPASAHRGALKDHNGVMRVAHLLDSHPAPEQTFVPTVGQIDTLDKYSTRCIANSTRGYPGAPSSDSYGKLWGVQKMLYTGKWPAQTRTDWQVGTDLWLENSHASRNRAFDCEGMCR